MYSIKTFKKALLLMLLMAVIMPWKVNAQETLTVCEGTNTSTNAPIKNGGGSQSEFIYPATLLEDMDGGTISSVKFFSSTTSTSYSNTVTVYVEEVSETTETTSAWCYNQSTALKVYEGTALTVTNGEMEITFSTPYDYNGGNLCFNIWSASSTPSVSYYGVNPGYAACGYDYYITPPVSKPYSTAQFLPKVEFTYEAASVSCAKPKNFNATDITAHEATLTWTAGAEGQSNWDVYMTTDATDVPDENTMPSYQVTECSQTLSGLTPETTYYAYVRGVCGGEDGNSNWAKKTFTTEVACPKPTLSYVTNSNTAFTGSVSWTGNADNYELIYSTKYSFEPGDEGVIQIDLDNVNTYTLQDLTPETTYRIKVRANCGSDDGYSQWSNQVSFTTTATCVAPSGLSATATATTVTLNWTAGAQDQDAWDIRYKSSSDSEYTMIHIDNQTTTSYTLTGLNPVTTYNVNVRAYCSEEDQSKWGYSSYNQNSDLSITTDCAALSLPYTCDFEGAVETSGHFASYPVPKCWDRIEMQYGNYSPYTYYPYVYDYSPYAHDGTKSLRMYRTPNSANQTIILPTIDDSYEMSNLQIRFWAMAGSSNNTLSVGVMENDNFVQVCTVEGISTTYAEYTALLSEYSGNGRNIAIKCGSSSSYLYYYIDDVTVEVIPSCFIPTGLAATVNSATETVLTWTAGGNETAWELEITAEGSSIAQTAIVSGNPTYTLTTTRATTYTARVRANCGDDDYSDWSAPIGFVSDCGILTVDATHPFLEDFENVDASDFPPICWDKFSHEMSGYTYWYLNSNNGLGSSAAYSYWSEGYAFLVMPKMHIDGAAKLSFDYLIGSGTYNESCSVVVSTGEMTYNDFNQTIWEANGSNSGNASATVSLQDFDGEDIYIAFKFKGLGTSGCTWYVDNVQVYVGEIFTKDIAAYTGQKDRYYLISSPIGTVDIENVTNLTTSSYDLYYFDQAATDGLEWINYEPNGTHPFSSLESGKGYLYANSQDVTLKFIGTPYNDNGVIDLTYSTGADFAGWNLIGNPFATSAILDKPYYRLNTNGDGLKTETESTAVNAMEGVFVQATETGQSATFAAQTRGSEQTTIARTDIVVSDDNGNVLDNAIVRFDNGEALGKFQLKQNSTKVYIPVDGKDYAVASVATQSELPVNFKAAENGTYSIVVSSEDVELNYLHLIDNLTGADVDLLECPSYSFEAKTTDYESRFKLVFVCEDGPSTGSGTFAFISNDKLVVLNDGEATLQVFDMMGRMLDSQAISGTAETSINAAPGVYMLRLVSGNDVKVQKVVMR